MDKLQKNALYYKTVGAIINTHSNINEFQNNFADKRKQREFIL